MEYLQYTCISSSINDIVYSFKPYYKWNTFNTYDDYMLDEYLSDVLNLIINGIPSIPSMVIARPEINKVLNLIINGIPSIPQT